MILVHVHLLNRLASQANSLHLVLLLDHQVLLQSNQPINQHRSPLDGRLCYLLLSLRCSLRGFLLASLLQNHPVIPVLSLRLRRQSYLLPSPLLCHPINQQVCLLFSHPVNLLVFPPDSLLVFLLVSLL